MPASNVSSEYSTPPGSPALGRYTYPASPELRDFETAHRRYAGKITPSIQDNKNRLASTRYILKNFLQNWLNNNLERNLCQETGEVMALMVYMQQRLQTSTSNWFVLASPDNSQDRLMQCQSLQRKFLSNFSQCINLLAVQPLILLVDHGPRSSTAGRQWSLVKFAMKNNNLYFYHLITGNSGDEITAQGFTAKVSEFIATKRNIYQNTEIFRTLSPSIALLCLPQAIFLDQIDISSEVEKAKFKHLANPFLPNFENVLKECVTRTLENLDAELGSSDPTTICQELDNILGVADLANIFKKRAALREQNSLLSSPSLRSPACKRRQTTDRTITPFLLPPGFSQAN